MRRTALCLLCLCTVVGAIQAQDPAGPKPADPQKKDPPTTDSPMKGMDHSQMQGMDHSKMAGMEGMDMSDDNPAGMLLMDQASGTSLEPKSWPMPMRLLQLGSWRTMFMANAFIVDTQQSGPRGSDKFYAPNWFMGAAQHSLGKGSFQFQLMLSLDPATITGRSFPELF
jgi:hypothetical protein